MASSDRSSATRQRCMLATILSALYISCAPTVCIAFAPQPHRAPALLSARRPVSLQRNTKIDSPMQQKKSSSTQLFNGNQFDISKPTFDLFSFRFIRSDALVRYNSLNQSEPLRVNLYLLATVSLLGYPLWCESVTGDVATTTSTIAACAAGVGTAALFWRERTRRSKQLNRMEKELNAESLQVKVPVNKAISSARPTASLKDLRSKRRIIAIRGSKDQLSGQVWDTLCTLRRRLVQSQTLVVLVPTDGSQKEDWGFDTTQLGSSLWLADPLKLEGDEGWLNYFIDLLDNGDESAKNDNELAWFALNFKGRSIASGLGEAPRILELLGQQLQPMDLLDETDEAEISTDVPVAKQILECQQKFYNVLTDSSDEKDMQPIFTTGPAEEVDEVINAGGRIDDWKACLKPGARPEGMVISGSDVWVPSENVAYSTCIEFPPNAGIDGATLLAVQRWGRDTADGDWKLELHQTIPWATGSRAGGTLRCDCRGCVALARAQDKRTFGGLIG